MLSLEKRINIANKKLESYKGKKVIIPLGKYKGRIGIIESPHIDSTGKAIAVMRPVNIGNHGDPLLCQHNDARTYWPLTDDILIKEYGR